ncbi:NAD(P)-dependent oxidoreductase [Aliidiomarina sedimenti]|uniref:NAD(P)-dependent oxidoreductase n=1 Tax=Aliidiomarina sedimenti TaxID=1933879 RepID=A0ABY0C1H8_9GAMM|nr:SDR family oxidoreductase [Aliidiomarina sedimenti]RUO31599.1 NAD(P)-dependent oxidoreductase [Aliidiomarina sedimenti]
MRVYVIGANGKIGQHVVKQLQQHPTHQPVALVRKDEQIKALQAQDIEARAFDLTDKVETLKESLEGADAIIFTAGSGGSTEDDMTLRIDLDGAVKSMEAAELAGVKRFVIVSALQAHNREFWHPDITPYYVAKHYADRELMRSDLEYTIVRPGLLTDDKPTGQVRAESSITEGEIPRADVAAMLIEVLDKPNAVGKAFDMVKGNQSVESVASQL